MQNIKHVTRLGIKVSALSLILTLVIGGGLPALAANPGDVVINEIMQNPNAVADGSGEWFELFNPTASPIDINGWTIADNDVDSHVINNGAPLLIPAGGFLVLGNNADSGTNGGLTVDYQFSGYFLANGADEVVLLDDALTEIDRVEYDGGPSFPDPTGASMALSDPTLDNNVGSNWCTAVTSFGDGDLGTPGTPNDCDTTGGGNGNGGGINTPGPDPAAPELLLTEVRVTPTGGEFIEIHNPTGNEIDLSNVYLTDATFSGGGTFYYNITTGTNAGGGGFSDFHARFPAGATIAAGAYQTVAIAGSDAFFSEYGVNPTYELFEDGSSADAIPDMREALSGSINNQGGLTNSGEVVILYAWDGASDLVTDLDYALWGDKDEAVDKTGVSIDGPDADTDASAYLNDTAVANQDVIATGAHSGSDSWQREDLTEGAEIQSGGNGVGGDDETSENVSTTWCANTPTPNEASDCGGGGGPVQLFIHEVQGSGAASPRVGETVTIEGIVVGDFQDGLNGTNGDLNGFFVQEEDVDADSDPATSEGIFVFDGSSPAVNVANGDLVRVEGPVSEFDNLTEITSFSGVTVISNDNPLPTTSNLSLPVTSVDDFEAYEGMRVTFPQALYISEYFNFDRFGEIVLTADRQFQPTAIYEPGSLEAANLALANSLSRITLDDGRTISNPDPAIHPNGDTFDLTNLFRGGDTVKNVTGVMHYGFGLYRIQPTKGADYTSMNARTMQPDDVGGGLKVASFNVLNYFTTLDQIDDSSSNNDPADDICGPSGGLECRGADASQPEEFGRQRAKIINAISQINADIVGLIEIENHPGDVPTADLVSGLNDVMGAGTYDFIATGGIGTDAIRVAFIYKPTSVSLIGDFAVLDDPSFTDPLGYGEEKSRPALAQTFMDNNTGGIFTAVVNHLKSKGSACAPGDDDPEQGNCNLTRALGAQALVDWLATDPTGSGDEDFVIIGDLNSYDKEDPIDALVAGGYTDLLLKFVGENAYSYVFDGQLGYLDHALANQDLLPEVTGATAWHINADEPDILDYDTTFKRDAQDALYEPNAYRSSDHDPVIVGLAVCDEIAPTLEVTVSPDSLSPPDHKYVTVAATVTAADDFDPNPTVTLLSVESNEPDNGLGDGDKPNDIVIIDDTTFDLRAERSGSGNGRIYTITYEVTDSCGNSTIASAEVSVPHDLGQSDTVDLQFLSVSDWHAQLDPLSVFGEGTFGGAAQLSTYWKAEREANPNTLTLTAGDAYGASPPLANFFNEEPAVLAMNLMGFDVDTFGNHNFDGGLEHLQQMIDLAEFKYVSANLDDPNDELSGFKDFEIFELGGVKVAVIGITNPEAPSLVFPGNFGSITPTDPIQAVKDAQKEAKKQGAQLFVVIAHMGVTSFDADGNPSGPIVDLANGLNGIDLIFGDHTDAEFGGFINDILVVENRSRGRTYARVNLTFDSQNGQVLDRSVEFVEPVSDAVTPDQAIVDLLQPFRDQLEGLFSVVVGESTVFIPRADACGQGAGRTCESLIGNVTTDAMRETYSTDFAITNSGGLRANLTCPTTDDPNDFCPPFSGPNFDITRGQVQTVLPFGNVVAQLTVNGAELKDFLENGVSAMPGADGRFPQVSGLCFTYDISAPAGSRVLNAVHQAADGSCTGPAVDLSAGSNYTLAINDFMANGGDDYPNVASRIVTQDFMDEVVSDYIGANTPISPAIQGRINCTGADCPVVSP